MHKKVEFYKIDYKFLPIINYSQELKNNEENKLISTIINKLNSSEQHTLPINSDNPNIVIETSEFNSDYIFGIIGKLQDLHGGVLRRFRIKEDISVLQDLDSNNLDLYLENYTYFYIRLSDMICIVLSNSSAPKFKTHFGNFLRSITSNLQLEHLNVISVIDDNIDYKIDRIKNISQISMIFDDSSSVGAQFFDLQNSFNISQSSLRKANIKLNLEVKSIPETTKELFKNSNVIRSEFNKFEIDALNEEEGDIQLDLVDHILTKKVFIDIEEEYLKNTNDLNKIKEALIKALP